MSKKFQPSERMNKARKQYKKEFKKLKKELIKRAKNIKLWDYFYFNAVVFQLIRLFYSYYSKPDLLYQAKDDNYKTYMKALTRCKEIVDTLEPDIGCLDYTEETKLLPELYNLIGKYIQYWWD